MEKLINTIELPTLEGTEKQIAWANQIREDAINTILSNITLAKQRKEKYGEPIFDDCIKAFEQVLEQLIHALQTYTKAADLINRREHFSSSRILQLENSIENRLTAERNIN